MYHWEECVAMHWFQMSKDYPGELELNFPWLPYWIVHRLDVLEVVKVVAQESLPKDLKVSELTEEHYISLDSALISGLEKALPYVSGLRPFMESLTELRLDATKAPKAAMKKKKDDKSPEPPWDPLSEKKA